MANGIEQEFGSRDRELQELEHEMLTVALEQLKTLVRAQTEPELRAAIELFFEKEQSLGKEAFLKLLDLLVADFHPSVSMPVALLKMRGKAEDKIGKLVAACNFTEDEWDFILVLQLFLKGHQSYAQAVMQQSWALVSGLTTGRSLVNVDEAVNGLESFGLPLAIQQWELALFMANQAAAADFIVQFRTELMGDFMIPEERWQFPPVLLNGHGLEE